ncbi:MAG: porphobilinogen synthase, partial [Puniceicoccales bacterium]
MSQTPFRLNLTTRPRRLRRTNAIRRLVRETQVRIDDLIQPLFVIDGEGECEAIESMPGQSRLTIPALVRECEILAEHRVPAVAIFPKLDPSLKTAEGREALNPDTLVLRAVRAVKVAVPELAIITDVALDPYTNHGHDGLLSPDGKDVANDETVEVLRQMAVLNAEAGADFVAPSDMMDGRVGAIREALDDTGLSNTAIMAYSAKFNSAYYGPFRDAVGSAQAAGTHLLGKDTYQCDPANRRAAVVETELDEAEGADVLMVKPAGAYLDIIRELRD